MKFYYTDHFDLPLPPEHRFPMAKYRLLRERVASELLDAKLVDGVLAAGKNQLVEPHAATIEELARAHDVEYIRRALSGELTRAEIRRIGFPWSAELIERSRRSSGATLVGARAALEDGCAVNLAGGTHHAFADCGEGYCLFNDAAVAALNLLADGAIRRAIVIDLDVHQGNGSAAILANHAEVFTYSIHGAKNFPFRKFPSDVDVPLPDGTDNDGYLAALNSTLPRALSAARADLAIYLAGADPFEGDRLGRFKLTKEGLLARDAFVFEACRVRSIPLVIAMAGGYAKDINDIVDIHFQTIALANSIW